jgi:hypothetical protein
MGWGPSTSTAAPAAALVRTFCIDERAVERHVEDEQVGLPLGGQARHVLYGGGGTDAEHAMVERQADELDEHGPVQHD